MDRRVVTLIAVTLFAGAFAMPAGAEPARKPTARTTDLSAQANVRSRRPHIRVTPRYRLLYRDCEAWLAQEYRPSGTVIVPRQRCWWVRG